MAQKRISRARKRDLEKPDEFLTLTSRVLEKIKTNWKPISLGCAVLLAILVGVLAFGYFSERAERQAFVLLEQAMSRYTTDLSRMDASKAIEAVTPEFEALFSKYGDRQAGAAGRLMFAQMNLRAGHLETAVAQYEAAVRLFPEGSYAASAAWSGLGYAQAAIGHPERAIAAFTNIVAGQDPILKADALYQLTLLYRKTNQEVEYEKTLKTLREDYPDYIYAEMLPPSTDG